MALRLVFLLCATCMIEWVVAFWMKIREKKVYLLIFFVNMLTNPLANLLYAYGSRWAELSFETLFPFLQEAAAWTADGLILMAVETLVVLCEAWIYHKFSEWFSHPVLYALAANMLSAVTGVCLPLLLKVLAI